MAVWTAMLGWGAAGGLLLLAWGDSLLLAMLLGSFLTGSWLIDWDRGATCISRTSLQGERAVVAKANTGLGKETGQGLAAMGARAVLAGRDVQQGETAKYGADWAVKRTTSQGMDDIQAKKRRKRCQGIVGDISPMHPPNNPEPMAAGPDSPTPFGGTDLQAATLKAVHEATAVTESASEQGEVGESGGERRRGIRRKLGQARWSKT